MDESTTRVAAKATRMMVLYRLRTERRLAGLSDIQLAKAFGVRRETIWRDRQALQVVGILTSVWFVVQWGHERAGARGG